LELLGRFLARKLDWSIDQLLKALDEKRLDAKALMETENGMTGQIGVAAALELSWQELNDAEQELACVSGMFAIAPIPWSLVEGCQSESEPDDLEDIRDDGLMARSLLNRVGESIYQLHQIVQEYFRIKLAERTGRGESIKTNFCQVMVEIAKTMNPNPLIDEIQLVREKIVHLEEAARFWTDNVNDEGLIWLFLGIGDFYEGQGYYSSAEDWRRHCLEATQQRFGEKHRDVATSQCKLGVCLESQGKYQEAELFYRSALEMRQHLLGKDHLDVATSMSDLAVLYKLRGKYQEAEFFHLSALTMYHHLLGKEHESIALGRNNLAELYRCQQRYGEAEFLYFSALEISQRLLGQNHLSIAIIHNNLALLYCSQGKYQQARLSYISSLEIYQYRLEEGHPHLAIIYNNLALFYYSQGEYGEAESRYLSALEIYQHQPGGSHPDVATIQWNLGVLYQKQCRYPEAEALYCQALAIAQSKLGSDHPTTQGILSWLNSLPQPRV
jgi:tetratricopeptide (TPR) repeat protein